MQFSFHDPNFSFLFKFKAELWNTFKQWWNYQGRPSIPPLCVCVGGPTLQEGGPLQNISLSLSSPTWSVVTTCNAIRGTSSTKTKNSQIPRGCPLCSMLFMPMGDLWFAAEHKMSIIQRDHYKRNVPHLTVHFPSIKNVTLSALGLEPHHPIGCAAHGNKELKPPSAQTWEVLVTHDCTSLEFGKYKLVSASVSQSLPTNTRDPAGGLCLCPHAAQWPSYRIAL